MIFEFNTEFKIVIAIILIFYTLFFCSYQVNLIFKVLVDFIKLVKESKAIWQRKERTKRRMTTMTTPIKTSRPYSSKKSPKKSNATSLTKQTHDSLNNNHKQYGVQPKTAFLKSITKRCIDKI